MKKIILASASPRRRELLGIAGVQFEVITKDVDESVPEGIEPHEAAVMTAKKKALAVAEEYSDSVVIGADTIVVANGKILGKPKDEKDAFNMLKMLSGIEHQVITGVCIVCKNKIKTFEKTSSVRFYGLSDKEIEAYIQTGEPMDKAGSYGIQGKGSLLVESISGDYFNIVGLPVASTVRALKEFE